MLKKIISLVVILTTLSTSTYASVNNGLRTALDELNYSLTVEWDQTDKEFFNQQVERFKETIQDLRREGLSDAELLTFLNSQVPNDQVARDLKQTFSIVNISEMSPSELNDHILSTARKSQQTGASWNGYAVLAQVTAGLVVLGLFVWYVSANSGTPGNAEMELLERKRQQDIKNYNGN